MVKGTRSSGDQSQTETGTADRASESDSRESNDGANRLTNGGSGDGGIESDDLADAELERVQTAMNRCADGDLTVRLDENAADDRIAAIAAEFNRLVRTFSETIDDVDEFGEQVTGASDHVGSRVDDVKDTSKTVSTAVSHISDSATEQHARIDTATGELQTLSATTEEIASSAAEAAATAQNVAERGQDGRNAATGALEELDDINNRTGRARESVERLDERIAEVEGIVELIRDIADETNLLALNASIQAAKAGEEGNGFAVVANEIKSLAEEAHDATAEIETSIDEIRDETNDTVAEIEEMHERVTTGLETAESALEAFTDLVDDIEETTVAVEEISEATDEQASSVEAIVSMADDIADISDDTSTKTDDVTVAAREQTTSLTEVAASVSALKERATAIESLLDTYDTSTVRVETDATVLEFWHAMGGDKGVLLDELIAEFEAQTDGIRIESRSKGSYRGTFDATLSAVERGSPPAIAQLYEIGTKRALDSDAFVPVERVLSGHDLSLDELLDPVLEYYRTDGQLYSMPFNASTPVLYFNEAAFDGAGLQRTSPPRTFDEVRDAAEQLVDAGVVDAGITFANYSWFIEQWFAEQNQPLVDENNGRDGTPTEAYLDGDAGRTVYDWLTGLDRDGLYHDPGIEARGKARERFHAGDAAMLIDSTSSLTSVVGDADFDVGTGYFPVPAERHGVVVGGGSLWITAAASREERRAAAEFLAWLAQPKQQARWHKETGYFPIHEEAVERLDREGWFREKPGYETAIEQLLASENTPATNGARMGPFNTVRTLIAEASDNVIPEFGVDDGLERLNDQVELQLRRYRDEDLSGIDH
ncbi:MCP domain-containing signal transducer [Natrialba chahannaoensis JCM 10990]|uniref:MCP domain-containing signal transducer n=1 Tax=Natrialba chahannaoensis JCM 10990 TaxID=1227492 RepID=M0AGE1_9EURY|nr:extracellular solute-binding protein [Natrialba chahannaoensis]ELY97609.1 MCP domain-containing signal transducer [Natrialba chahannaoensis JCM 10990]